MACELWSMVLVTMDAAKDVRYCEVKNCGPWRVNCGPCSQAVDSPGGCVGAGAAIACVPVLDPRWDAGGPRPYLLGIMEVVVSLKENGKKRLGLEMRGLLAVLGLHTGQCITNAIMHQELTQHTARVMANQVRYVPLIPSTHYAPRAHTAHHPRYGQPGQTRPSNSIHTCCTPQSHSISNYILQPSETYNTRHKSMLSLFVCDN
jgi:hypothetical protein